MRRRFKSSPSLITQTLTVPNSQRTAGAPVMVTANGRGTIRERLTRHGLLPACGPSEPPGR
jgi:hypothetical protein